LHCEPSLLAVVRRFWAALSCIQFWRRDSLKSPSRLVCKQPYFAYLLSFIDDRPHRASGRSVAMNLRQCLVLIGMLWPVSGFSAAGDTFFTGTMLHRYCSESSESCTSYIAGVVDALITVGAAQKTPLICLHDRTDLGQAVDVIANYLRAHPEKR
jgi:Ssp1 endopeptidase immunity protein Rap1a